MAESVKQKAKYFPFTISAQVMNIFTDVVDPNKFKSHNPNDGVKPVRTFDVVQVFLPGNNGELCQLNVRYERDDKGKSAATGLAAGQRVNMRFTVPMYFDNVSGDIIEPVKP